MTSSYLLQCFGTMRLFVLGAQFDTARTSRLLFHPPRTSSCCVFLHLRTHPQILRLIPHWKRHVDFSIMGLLLIFDILYVPLTLITGLTSLSDDLGIPFDVMHCSVGYFFTPVCGGLFLLHCSSEPHVIESRIYFASWCCLMYYLSIGRFAIKSVRV